MRQVVILGSTGSIGESAVRVAQATPEALKVVGLAARCNGRRLLDQARALGVKTVALEDLSAAEEIAAEAAAAGVRLLKGPEGVEALAALEAADTVLVSVVGLAGLRPTLAAMRAGKDIALATKEVLVSAGDLVMKERRRLGVKMLPVDSEHSAIFQALQSVARTPACVRVADEPPMEPRIAQLILTASGGPFANRPEVDFETVTPELALKHPSWNMGPKVTIDSATMLNKGLEILEAHHLFTIPVDRIGVLVHPGSIVHSLVEFDDGVQLAQLSQPDMRFPIRYAFTWPDRVASPEMARLDLAALGRLEFSRPDERRFRSLALAREAARMGGTATAALNAADEIAVAAFLKRQIRFSEIPRVIEKVLSAHDNIACDSFEAVFAADERARALASEICGGLGQAALPAERVSLTLKVQRR